MSDTQYFPVPGDASFRPQRAQDNRYVQFSKRPHLNKAKSKELNRPWFDARVFITLQHPGDNNMILERLATDNDAIEFPRQWAAYQSGTAAIPEGTLLSIMIPDSPEVVENLKYFKIYVVEQLAALTDTQIQAIGMGGRKLVQDAQAFLKAAQSGGDFSKLRDDVSKLMLDVRAKSDRITALEGELKRREDLDRAKTAPPAGQQPQQQRRA